MVRKIQAKEKIMRLRVIYVQVWEILDGKLETMMIAMLWPLKE